MKLLSRVWLLATPWTAAYQAPPSMGFSRQEYWSGVPLPSPSWTLFSPLLSDSLFFNTFTDHVLVDSSVARNEIHPLRIKICYHWENLEAYEVVLPKQSASLPNTLPLLSLGLTVLRMRLSAPKRHISHLCIWSSELYLRISILQVRKLKHSLFFGS